MNTETGTTLHFYQGDQLQLTLNPTTSRTLFRHQDQTLAEQCHDGGHNAPKILATNSQGSVLVSKTEQGRCSLSYNAYGHSPVEDAQDVLVGFNGETRDLQTGCYLLGNGYRAFSTITMRFSSPDSYSPFGSGGMNPYMYCEGDPINLVDPSGHSPWTPRRTALKDQGIYRPQRPIQRTEPNLQRRLLLSRPANRQMTSTSNRAGLVATGGQAETPADLSFSSEHKKLIGKVSEKIAKEHHRDNTNFYTPEYRNYKKFLRASAKLIIESERDMNKKSAINRFFRERPEVNDPKVRSKILAEATKIRNANA